MGNRFASDRRAIAECDRCGFRYKRKELKELIIKTKNVNILVCHECWEPDQPQLLLGMFPVDDPQAIRNPRPDFTGYPQSRAWIIPVQEVSGTVFIGTVDVVTT